MNHPATANPHPVFQGKVVVDRFAAVATLRTGEKPIKRHQGPVVPQGFILQLPTGFAEGRIHNRSGQLGSRHPFDTQVFDADQVKASDKARRHLVDEIVSLTADLLVNQRHPPFGFLAPVAALLSPGKGPLGSPLAPGRLAGKLRGRDRFAGFRPLFRPFDRFLSGYW